MLANALDFEHGTPEQYLLRLRYEDKVRKLLEDINTLTSEMLREIFSDPEVSYLFILLVPLMRKMPFPALKKIKKD